ncbi:hypothetical protein KSF_044150 [Reticulibacter mediterranei]|uniref:Uncharacterized protein n=1 Tax=Reticulibacter mediterranei TaxID=2778369 RepID=A0A8J3N4R8_9CHLR|nr:hypothetical protein [Reticulibacter mediterranei]GHO94367.1 hypothetical protein KSF_044150 [Reticulibacter mediterranei]
MGLSLLKYARKATKSCGSYLSKRKSQRTGERKTGKAFRRKRLRSLVLTILSVPGLLIMVLSAAGLQSGATAGSGSATDIPQLQQYTAIIGQGNRLSALQSSADSTLTAYPDDRPGELNSAVIDEKTGKQSYVRGAGNGGVAVATYNIADCPDMGDMGNQVSKYGKQDDPSTHPTRVEGDLLTGNGGWLYNIPLDLTTQNTAIKSFVQVLQTLAEALLVLVIMMIGIRIAMGGGGGWSFGELLEVLPRLVFSVIAVALCLTLAEELISCANALIELFQGVLSNAGASVGPANIVMPLSLWGCYLTALSYSGAAIMIAMAIAPLSAFGFNFGGYIAAALVGTSVAFMIKYVSAFCILGLTMALTAMVIMRILLINVYIILSPLAVIAAGMPGHTGQGFARQWILGFLSLLAAQFAQVVALGVGMVMLTAYDHTYAPSQGDMGELFIRYGILLLMLRVPTLFSSNSTAILRETGPALGAAILRDKAPFSPGGA